MIYKSFYRKKSTKIYLALFSLIFIFLLFINISYNNINRLIVDNIIDSTLAYRICNSDCYEELDNSDMVANIKYSYLAETTIDEDYLEEFNSSRTDNKLLLSENKKLKNNEVILYYEDYYYRDNKDIIDNMKTIHINKVEYNIKEIKQDSNISHIEVSSSTINLLKDDEKYTYLFNLKVSDEVIDYVFDDINNLTMHTAEKFKVATTLNKYLGATKIFSILISIVSIIIYAVVLNNLFDDFNRSNKLEKFIGFKKSKRRLNCYLRITSLLLLSILISMTIVLLISLLLGIFIKEVTIEFNYFILLYLIVIDIIKFVFLFVLHV